MFIFRVFFLATMLHTDSFRSQLLALLSRPPYHTAKELALYLACTPKTVYNRIEVLRDQGYRIERTKHKQFYLRQNPDSPRISVPFSPKELNWLRAILREGLDPGGMAVSLLSAFDQAERSPIQTHPEWHLRTGMVLDQLYEAMKANCQIRVEGYRSGNSPYSGSRILSPLRLNLTGSILIAYEPSSERVKYYRLSRIQAVHLLEEAVSYNGPSPEPDLFGWGGETEEIAELALTLHATNYLMEEHFEAGKFLSEVSDDSDFPYRLRIAFKHPQGIGRFVMSMPQQVKILAPMSLLEYVREAVKWWG